MDAFFLEEKIHDLLAAKFQEASFQDCFLVEFLLSKSNKLEVFIDCDDGITLEKCRQISRYLESFIDEENWFGEVYTLEVSSPGLDRPLKLKRQYLKNIGRQLEITLKDGTLKQGTLTAVNDLTVTLEETVVTKEGKKKVKAAVLTELPYDDMKKAMVVISF